MKLAQTIRVEAGSTLTNAQFDVYADGTIKTNTGDTGTVILTGITSNGLVKTIKVVFE